MITRKSVDLYEHFHQDRKDAKAGILQCWIRSTHTDISPGRRHPAILILPGGAYRFTSPREAEPVALHFMTKGYAVFVLEYSCAPSSFPAALREAAFAVRFIRENAQEMEVNPNMVAVMGFSAGGHLCGSLGTMYDCPEVRDIGPPALLRPDAIGLSYPVAVSWGATHQESFQNISGGDEALKKRLSLDSLVRPDMPPVFLWHTRNDQSVPVRNSLILASALEEAGVDFVLHIYHNGVHGLSTADEQTYPVYRVPNSSTDIPEWPDKMMLFFKELGFAIIDTEGSE